MTYENVNNFIIIKADDRNPDISFRHHRERGSLGGVDCVAPIGTPILAPDECVIRNIPNNGSGGNTVQLHFNDGWIDQMMHLSEFVTPGEKRKGDLIGVSGDSGAPGQPHVHWHRIGEWHFDEWGSTNRYNPFSYFVNGNGSKINGTDEMNLLILPRKRTPDSESDGRVFWFQPGMITHTMDEQVVKILSAIGVRSVEVYRDDFRRIVEANGLEFESVDSLKPGEAAIVGEKGGTEIIPAGIQPWPPNW